MGNSDDRKKDLMSNSLIEIAVESWRFIRLFRRVLDKLDAGESAKYASQMRYFQKNLETSLGRVELKIVDVVDQPYEPGMAAAPLNLDEFDANDRLRVDQMVEPIIMGPEGLLRAGTVMLRKDDL